MRAVSASSGAAAADAEADSGASSLVATSKRDHGAKLMMEGSVFAELELAEAAKKVAGVRVRQHVNPLKASLQAQAPAPA